MYHYCQHIRPQIVLFGTGNAMGGSTSVNSMVFLKGSREDFDNWAALGNDGWDYDSILPYYKKCENYEGLRMQNSGKFP